MSLFHAVTLDKDKCLGCTNCIKRCPTEAIRVREGKAKIIDERCIDCGECIRICPQHAKRAVTDSLEKIKQYRYPVALPAPSLYSQFNSNVSVDKILAGLLELGFVRVWEVARGAEIVSRITEKYLKEKKLPRPVISSACPAVVRLIKVRYPELSEHILPVYSPMEASARIVKREMEEEGYPPDEVGVFFISPCAAKFTAVKNPIDRGKSYVDGVVAISDIFGPLYNVVSDMKESSLLQKSGSAGIGWAVTGGEVRLINEERRLAVDGLNHVARVFEDVAMGKLKDIDFIEGLACSGGCVGGPLTVENPYMAKARILALINSSKNDALPELPAGVSRDNFIWQDKLKVQGVLKLDEDMAAAIKKMDKLDKIHRNLPGLDCGSCGAPTCRALAEDIVQGQADEVDCIFKLREKVTELAEKMVELSSKLPPSMKKDTD